ncbi:gamma-secretase subunit pen-2 isoform X1 [Harpegnathos saltator]|uniref:gamma-secretase subunit pen-2 isoform X1 n=1 Tax=Harpegnathos saltator TaxID=610380 RepID=UPI000DBEDECF|nr:gamma-secretase subunit pen-2 isoform X1 [Harpegnathos saltator]
MVVRTQPRGGERLRHVTNGGASITLSRGAILGAQRDSPGFALLPFLWAVNVIWFWKEAFTKPLYEEQKQIKKYVIISAIGATVWAIALLAWIITFQTQRAAWGEFGDAISYIIPTGIP